MPKVLLLVALGTFKCTSVDVGARELVGGSAQATALVSGGTAALHITAGRPKPQATLAAPVGMREKLGSPVRPLRLIIVGHNPSEVC
jgi:hypothetical protein